MTIDQARANIVLWLIRSYHADLAAYYAGDEARFSRMVVDGGAALPTAHPAGWAQHITSCTTPDAIRFYKAELIEIYSQLIQWRLVAELPAPLAGQRKDSN